MATYKSIRYLVPDEVVEHTDSINALADVDTSTVAPEVGQTLKWIGNSKWKPRDIDSTNQAPTISSPGVATIAESTVTGRAVATILSSDPENDPLTFSITAGNTGNAFTISNTGAITTAAALDYETTTSYTLTINAIDLAGNGDTITQTVNVIDNATPVISNTSSVTLAENAAVGTSISTISATDAEGDTITYAITAGNIADVFTINSSTGEITTGRILDYEFTNSYNLTITATDTAGEIGTTTQTVNVTNVTETNPGPTQKAIFGFGYIGTYGNEKTNVTNLVSSTGVVATDTTGVGMARDGLAAAGFGGDKAIFGFGSYSTTYYNPPTNVTNLVSNTGVVATDTTGVGTARDTPAAAGYGRDKAIFGFGHDTSGYGTFVNITNKVSNTGVVVANTTGVGTARHDLAASGYGGDKAIFGFGWGGFGYGNVTNISNLVSNLGVVATDTTGVGTARWKLAAAGYGGDKALFGFGGFGYGSFDNVTNLVSNTGVVASNTTGVGTARYGVAAAGYGEDKAIFGFGEAEAEGGGNYINITNLVSNAGVVASDTTGVGTGRQGLAAAGYSSTA